MGWDMTDETARQRHQAVSLTTCGSWDETWLVRLPGKEIKQCHSLSDGHRMRHDWWDTLAKKYSSVTHSLLVMGWDMIDETPWQRNKAVSYSLPVDHGMPRHDGTSCEGIMLLTLTHCQPWDETYETSWQRTNVVLLTFYLWATELFRL